MKRPTTFLKTIAIISMFCFSCHKAFDIQMKASAYAVNNSASGILNYDTATKHGIIPNDTMPDSDSIQALINSVSQNTEIFFPAGTYRINRPVSLARFRNSINLKGESGNVWKFDNSAAYNKIYNLRVGMLNIAANYNEIDNICFDQNFRDSDSADGNNALIACIIIGSWPSGSNTKTNQPTSGTTIKNCTINDYYGDAISVYNSSAKDLTITGNILRSAYIIEGWHTAGTRGEQGINVHSGSNVIIQNNAIYGALDDAIATHSQVRDVTISDNIITTAGGRVLLQGIKNGVCTRNTISYLDNERGDGIWITYEPQKGGILQNDSSLEVSYNKITITGYSNNHAIRLFGPGLKVNVYKNKVYTKTYRDAVGIEVINKVDSLFLGISYFGDSISVHENTIVNFSEAIHYQIYNYQYSLSPTANPFVDTSGTVVLSQ